MKTINTSNQHTADLKELTVREWRALQSKVSAINKEHGENTEAAGQAFMDAGIAAVLVSLDGDDKAIAERSLELPLDDYLEIWAGVQAAIVPKAMTSVTNTVAQ
jgi:hypothetical protein